MLKFYVSAVKRNNVIFEKFSWSWLSHAKIIALECDSSVLCEWFRNVNNLGK